MTEHTNELGQPNGFPVDGWTSRQPPRRSTMSGRFCRVEPLDPDRHAHALRACRANRGHNGSVVRYRPAGVQDAALISRVVIESWRDAYSHFLPGHLLASLDGSPHHDCGSWESRIAEADSATWIIVDAMGTDIGVLRIRIGASSIPGAGGDLTTLYVLSQARGRGIGSEALAFARAEALDRAVPVLGLCVLAGNNRGNQFYAQRGACRVGERIAFQVDEKSVMENLYRLG
jgi:GNAT superfamily N-acetyltransferase